MKTERYFQALAGKTLVTNANRNYKLDYRKDGRKIIPIYEYNGHRIQMSMHDYCNVPTDTMLQSIDNEIADFTS